MTATWTPAIKPNMLRFDEQFRKQFFCSFSLSFVLTVIFLRIINLPSEMWAQSTQAIFVHYSEPAKLPPLSFEWSKHRIKWFSFLLKRSLSMRCGGGEFVIDFDEKSQNSGWALPTEMNFSCHSQLSFIHNSIWRRLRDLRSASAYHR